MTRSAFLLRAVICSTFLAAPVWADTVLAARTIPAKSIVQAEDLLEAAGVVPHAVVRSSDAIGMEARVTIYQGRPILARDLGPPALVERNQIVSLHYTSGGLSILTEGRVLDRAAMGEKVRVMNLHSRITVVGRVVGAATIAVP